MMLSVNKMSLPRKSEHPVLGILIRAFLVVAISAAPSLAQPEGTVDTDTPPPYMSVPPQLDPDFYEAGAYKTLVLDDPRTHAVDHEIGRIRLTKTNFGQFRNAFFPRNSGLVYLNSGSLWIGALVGRDTLVTTGLEDTYSITEFWPNDRDTIIRRSINRNDIYFHRDALSEQDLVSIYYDTLTNPFFTGRDQIDKRPHRSLNLKIQERSLQWSYDYAADFILFDYTITNIGLKDLKEVYIGIWIDGGTFFTSPRDVANRDPDNPVIGSSSDDIGGFLRDVGGQCGFRDTVNLAYVIDNDGDPNPPHVWNTLYSLKGAGGVRVLRTPHPNLPHAYNWWLPNFPRWDFGPRKAPVDGVPFRDMDGFLGTPYGDANKYFVMSSAEFDYNQITLALNKSADGWLPPPAGAGFFARGGNVRFLQSFGPFSLFPGQTISFTYAVVTGEDVHTMPTDFADLFESFQPEVFERTLDFSDIALNALWAGWVYDNPGIDTDGDGNFGVERTCVLETQTVYDTTLIVDSSLVPPETTIIVDTSVVPTVVETFFSQGDGVPDFKGASPPPAPKIRVTPNTGSLEIRWNGYYSENTPDPFTKKLDFEGYRVYMGASNMSNSDLTIVASYDLEDYNRYTYNKIKNRFELLEIPFSLERLRQIYGPQFFPLDFGVDNPLVFRDPATGEENLYYFTTQDWNRDDLDDPRGIQKRFPDAIRPMNNPDFWTEDDLTEDGYPKFYEYQIIIGNLIPSVAQYVSVTAFDYGSPAIKLGSLESSPLLDAVYEFPLMSAEEAQDKRLGVIVFPNPYRFDGDYREQGFEARGRESLPAERTRAINFTNLPPVCTIKIYSLDGDLIREIQHDRPEGGPRSMLAAWDLITRNSQPAVSGLYYWILEEPNGETQMGKLVLIM